MCFTLKDCVTLQGCTGSFTSIMGYLYHMKKCGKKESELEKLLLNCQHCGKVYKSKAGLEYHLKSEHTPVSFPLRCLNSIYFSTNKTVGLSRLQFTGRCSITQHAIVHTICSSYILATSMSQIVLILPEDPLPLSLFLV